MSVDAPVRERPDKLSWIMSWTLQAVSYIIER